VGTAFHMKTDIFKNIMFFSYESDGAPTPIGVPFDRVKEIIELNKKGVFPEDMLEEKHIPVVEKQPDFMNVVGQDSLTRFDNLDKKKKKKKNKYRGKKGNRDNNNNHNNQNANKKP
jgi:hypothetical protein